MADIPVGNRINRQAARAGATVDRFLNSISDTWDMPADLDLEQSKYNFTSRVFPTDLGGTSYQGHWMVININVKTASVYETINAQGRTVNNFQKLEGDQSKVDALRNTIDKQFTANGEPLGYSGLFLPRFTRRIVESIAIFMPPTVVYSTNNIYEPVGLTDLFSKAFGTAARLGSGLRRGSNLAFRFNNATNLAIPLLEKGAQAAGQPLNPKIEVLFANTDQRTFQFDFLCAPRDDAESQALEEIIRTMRFHAAPELNALTLGGILWTAPSEFDITFMKGDSENLHIPRINTCALEQIDIDYAPSGVYSTFSDGMPVSVRLQLRFKELEVVHKLRVLQGF